ncbi:MAG: GNAT family N-acetyltransferase [Acidobacteria bacterium]|nr:GNAT family N-acetyltransferase [Acidobacteriota bacterium]
MTVIVRNPGRADWDAYADTKVTAAFSHRFAWGERLAGTYQVKIFRLAAARSSGDRNLTGILPLMLFAVPDQDKRLISLPYTDAAGIVADDTSTRSALLEAALDLAEECGADHVELRQAGDVVFEDLTAAYRDQWNHTAHTFKTGLCRSLPDSVDQLWAHLPAKVRNLVRKARKCGCMAVIGGSELVDDFYAVFSENMRDLGSPVHARELFHEMADETILGASVLVVYIAGKPVAAAMIFPHGDTLFNPWASSLRSHRVMCPNMLLYWAMLEYAVQCGCRRFDFGRSSPDAATFRFKRQWGAEMQPLFWHVFSRKPKIWDPFSETLVDEHWKSLDLKISRREGPDRRRRISL